MARVRLLFAVLAILIFPALAQAEEKESTCTEDCWILSELVLRGAVGAPLTFELRGAVRSGHAEKIPLFGPPGQVRLDDVAIDGGKPHVAFDSDHYYLVTNARQFTLRGKITLGNDQMLSVPGPLLAVDAHLAKGRLVEGEKLSGVSGAVLHFDPSNADDKSEKPRAPMTFHLSRAIRFANETGFVYRLVASQGTDLGTLELELPNGEKVHEVQGSKDWKVDGKRLVLPTSGKEAEITISGSLPAETKPRTFSLDSRSPYEWWMIEADPEHRVSIGGEAKLVETSQSPIPPAMPGARVFLVQRGQSIEVESKSLVRGDVLAAVARTERRFIAVTGAGELIVDESVAYENNGLDHLMLVPAGKPMYLSTDQAPQSILHVEAGAKDVLVPLRPGPHALRVQSLSDVRIWPLLGKLDLPASEYPLATSAIEVTVGLPENVRPVAVLGGDRSRWAFSKADLIAPALGILVACFGFRTRKTRAIGALATAGLWFVSKEGFVVAAGLLFVVGAIFLVSRFLRGTWLFVASGGLVVVALVAGKFVLSSDSALEPEHEMLVDRPSLPTPEASHVALAKDGSLDTKAGVTPVSMSFPTSDRYVHTSRQLVTQQRPFHPRILYVTSTLVGIMHAAWIALVAALLWSHRDRLAALKAKIIERLTRRPDSPALPPAPAPVQPL
jgi:hypothetical protein